MEIRLWYERQKVGMTLRRLERETQISRNTLNRIENGLISPRLDDLEKIAEVLGCAISDLYESEWK